MRTGPLLGMVLVDVEGVDGRMFGDARFELILMSFANRAMICSGSVSSGNQASYGLPLSGPL